MMKQTCVLARGGVSPYFEFHTCYLTLALLEVSLLVIRVPLGSPTLCVNVQSIQAGDTSGIEWEVLDEICCLCVCVRNREED